MDGRDLLLLVLLLMFGAALAAFGWTLVQRHRLALQLRDARQRLGHLEGVLDVWSWQTDAAHRLLGVRPPGDGGSAEWSAARAGASLFDFFRPEHEAAFRARLDSAAALDDIEGARSTGSGPPCPGRLRGRPRTDALGAFAGYVGTVRDAPAVAAPAAAPAPVIAPPAATAPVAPVAPPRESEHESFSYTVSHDLRAPIRVVEGFTKIVKEDYGRLLDRVGNDHLDRVLGAAARMNSMIDALLSLSKLSSQPLARQPVNLSQLAGYVADDLKRQWPERQVRVDIEPGLQVLGDPTLLRVVLENLLGNAWKYSGKASDARIVFCRRASEADTFTVGDNGAGFDMRYVDRLFGVFQRLHSANDFPGTGIGLASVRRIVHRHGGTIWGEAEVNRGAQFHFSLPQRAAPRPAGPA